MRVSTSAVLAAVAALALAAPAVADQRITAGPVNTFTTPAPSIAQGEQLTFVNNDVATHSVTADGLGADGRPLFDTGLVSGAGASRVVAGAQALVAGSYAFHCTLHASMTGTLTVRAEGTPVAPSPTPPAADTTKPGISVGFPKQSLASIVKAKGVKVRVTLDEAASASVTVKARIGRRTLPLGPVKAAFKAAGSRTITLKLGSAVRKTFAGADSVRLTVSAQATDRAGNVGRAKTGKLTASR
jgi:plastocyanin